MKVKNICITALMTAFISVCSIIRIPLFIPVTLQNFAIYTTLIIFGGRLGLWSVIVYIFLGLAGVPVFSGFNSGIGYFLGPTGGFIIGFLMSAIIFIIREKVCKSQRNVIDFFTLIISGVMCYIIGTSWYVGVYGCGDGWQSALSVCVLPFIIPDIIKTLMALLVGKAVKKCIKNVNKN